MTEMVPVFQQTAFRIKADDTTGLNTDSGWHADENNNGTAIDAGVRFRVRFEVDETAGNGPANQTFKIQYNKNDTGWNDMRAIDDPAGTEPIEVTWSSQYADGDATTDLLTTATSTFEAGVGVEGSITSNTVSPDNTHTELEYCIMMHGVYGNNSQNSDGDTFELRLVEDDGTAFTGGYTNPTITLNLPAGFIGGSYIETPNRVGPWIDGNSNLYFVLESSPGNRRLVVVKSTDGGDTWTIQDGANAPTETDIEAADSVQVGDTIHIAVQTGSDVTYHTFRTSDHATNADTWGITDDSVAASLTAPSNQIVALEVRSDGDVVVFYTHAGGGDTSLYYKIDPGGGGAGWGSEQTADAESSFDCTGLVAIRGESDKIHIFYKMLGTTGPIYHRSLSSADSLSGREAIDTDTGTTTPDDRVALCEAVYWDNSGVEEIMVVYKDADDQLYSVVVSDDGTPDSAKSASDNTVRFDQIGSDQPCATLCNNGSTTYIMYSDNATADIYRDQASNDGGWGTDVEVQDAVQCQWIRAMSYTHSMANGGETVLGYVWDFGGITGAGETGQIKYSEQVLAVAHVLQASLRGTETHILQAVLSVGGTSTKTHILDATLKAEATTSTHLLDAILKAQSVASTHLLDAVLKAEASTSTHILDAVLEKQSVQSTHILDAVLKAEASASTHVLDTTLKAEATQLTHIFQAELSSAASATHTLDAILKSESNQVTHTLDSVLKSESNQITHIAQSILQKTTPQTHVLDATLKAEATTSTHVLDAILKSESNQTTHILQATTVVMLTADHVLDATLKSESNQTTHVLDSILKSKANQTTHVLQASITQLTTEFHTLDAILKSESNQATHVFDTILKSESNQTTHVLQATLSGTVSITHSLDSILKSEGNQATHTLDSILKSESNQATHTLDSVLKSVSNQATHVLDGTLKAESTQLTHTLDGILKETSIQATHILDATLVTSVTRTATHILDAVLVVVSSRSTLELEAELDKEITLEAELDKFIELEVVI